jgi:hypothetical protein
MQPIDLIEAPNYTMAGYHCRTKVITIIALSVRAHLEPDEDAGILKRLSNNATPRPSAARASRSHRWRRLCAIAALTLFLFRGCASEPPPGPDPRAAAQSYLTALKAGDYQTCYRMLVESDLVHGSLDGFLGQVPMAPNVERRWFGQMEAATEYRLGQVSQRGGEAIVPVNVTTPNLVLWERMLGERNQTPQAVQAAAENQFAGGDYPRLSYRDQIVMVREGDEWRLLAGFAQRERVARLHEQALSAYHRREYDEALSLYHQALERVGKARFSGSGELADRLGREMKRVEAARASADAARSYLPKLVIKNVETKEAVSGSPAMFGQIVNAGDVTLDEVELTVSYYSDAGKLVYTEKHTPVALPLEFTDFDMPIVPLKPGETRRIGIALNAPPEIQQQNKPRMTVSGVIFSETSPAPPKLAGSSPHPPRLTSAEVEAKPSAIVKPSATPSPKPENVSPTAVNTVPAAAPTPKAHERTRHRHRHESTTP